MLKTQICVTRPQCVNTYYDFVLNKHNGDDSPQSYLYIVVFKTVLKYTIVRYGTAGWLVLDDISPIQVS